jgi:cytochrome bd-type quinol oxidase subunit 2
MLFFLNHRNAPVQNMRQQTTSLATKEVRYSSIRTAIAGFGALCTVFAASSCCLPVLPLLLAAGFAGSSVFLSAVRPYLLIASVLFLAYGFYAAWRAKQCKQRQNFISLALLWIAAVFVVISILFPQVMADASASLLTH